LTGYVDGQLSAQEQAQAAELLRHSAEARTLLQSLQDDARLLGALPRTQLTADFTQQVQASLPKRSLKLAEFSTKSELRFPWRYAGVCATAATLLLALSIAYWQKSNEPIETNPANPDNNEFVEGDNERKPTLVTEVLPESRSVSVTKVDLAPVSSLPGTVNGHRPEILKIMPQPEEPLGIATAPVTPVKPLRKFEKEPLLLAMRDIDKDERRKEIAEELTSARSWRLDLTCQESEIASNRLKRAMQGQGIRLLIDPDASIFQSLRFKTPYAILVENVSPQECLAMVVGLRQADLQEQKRSRSSNQFIDVKFGRLSSEDEGRLESLFGLKEWKPEKKPMAQSAPALNSREVSALVRAFAIWQGQNLPEGQGGARNAFLVADTKNRVRKPSNENQLFLNSRQPPRPDMLQLFIVLSARKG
jgi:hypothetical protein